MAKHNKVLIEAFGKKKAGKNYTVKQGRIAEFIKSHNASKVRPVINTDSKLRCYIFNGQGSHLYQIIMSNSPYESTPIGDGVIEVTGSGKQEPRILHSSSCGIIFHTGL